MKKTRIFYGRAFRYSSVALFLVIATFSITMFISHAEAFDSTSIWTTDEYGNPRNVFYPGEFVYVHGEGFLSNSRLHFYNPQFFR